MMRQPSLIGNSWPRRLFMWCCAVYAVAAASVAIGCFLKAGGLF